MKNTYSKKSDNGDFSARAVYQKQVGEWQVFTKVGKHEESDGMWARRRDAERAVEKAVAQFELVARLTRVRIAKELLTD